MANYFDGDPMAVRGRFAICASRFNESITGKLLEGAIGALIQHRIATETIDVFRCPGAFELPALVSRVVERGDHVGVIAIGCVIRGDTPHFELIANACANGIAAIAVNANCAVTFGVLTTNTFDEAFERSGGPKFGNKGSDAAIACLELASLYAMFRMSPATLPFEDP